MKCDLTTMTPDDLREGTLTCLVGMAPMKPGEFIHYRIRIRLLPRCAITGPVVPVLDGDTIEVLHNIYPERVRLSGIDCPEHGQAFGHRAKQAASALVRQGCHARHHVKTSTDAHSLM